MMIMPLLIIYCALACTVNKRTGIYVIPIMLTFHSFNVSAMCSDEVKMSLLASIAIWAHTWTLTYYIMRQCCNNIPSKWFWYLSDDLPNVIGKMCCVVFLFTSLLMLVRAVASHNEIFVPAVLNVHWGRCLDQDFAMLIVVQYPP